VEDSLDEKDWEAVMVGGWRMEASAGGGARCLVHQLTFSMIPGNSEIENSSK
jgi:hypothetical protein